MGDSQQVGQVLIAFLEHGKLGFGDGELIVMVLEAGLQFTEMFVLADAILFELSEEALVTVGELVELFAEFTMVQLLLFLLGA